MQTLRNIFFYFSPLIGAFLGWYIGKYCNMFLNFVEILIGLGAGCVVSIVMLVLSVRARFKADPGLTNVQLKSRREK
jgi:zinc transporter ZupT